MKVEIEKESICHRCARRGSCTSTKDDDRVVVRCTEFSMSETSPPGDRTCEEDLVERRHAFYEADRHERLTKPLVNKEGLDFCEKKEVRRY